MQDRSLADHEGDMMDRESDMMLLLACEAYEAANATQPVKLSSTALNSNEETGSQPGQPCPNAPSTAPPSSTAPPCHFTAAERSDVASHTNLAPPDRRAGGEGGGGGGSAAAAGSAPEPAVPAAAIPTEEQYVLTGGQCLAASVFAPVRPPTQSRSSSPSCSTRQLPSAFGVGPCRSGSPALRAAKKPRADGLKPLQAAAAKRIAKFEARQALAAAAATTATATGAGAASADTGTAASAATASTAHPKQKRKRKRRPKNSGGGLLKGGPSRPAPASASSTSLSKQSSSASVVISKSGLSVLYRDKTRAEEQEESAYIRSLPFYTFEGDAILVNTVEHADELLGGWMEELDTVAPERSQPNAAAAAAATATAAPATTFVRATPASVAVAKQNKKLVTAPAFGFDIEWPVEYVKNAKQLPTALLQLAHPNGKCYLFRLSNYYSGAFNGAFPTKLREFIDRGDVLKVGVGIAGDVMKLERDFLINASGVVDLSELGNQVLESNQKWSLAGLVNQTLKQRLEKPGNTRISNWAAAVLSADQIKYAAADAAASLAVHNALVAQLR